MPTPPPSDNRSCLSGIRTWITGSRVIRRVGRGVDRQAKPIDPRAVGMGGLSRPSWSLTPATSRATMRIGVPLAASLGSTGAVIIIGLLRQSDLLHERLVVPEQPLDRKSTRLNSSHQIISYAVFCLKKKTKVTDIGHMNDIKHTQKTQASIQ